MKIDVEVQKATLLNRGEDLSGPCGAFKITKAVAWVLRNQDAGLLVKPTGNNCEGYAVDIIVFKDGTAFDILTDSGGENGPAWNPIEKVDPSRWHPPIEVDTVVPHPLPGPPHPAPDPPVPPKELTSDDLLDAVAERVQEILFDEFEQLHHRLDTIDKAQDRIYTGSIFGVKIVLHPEGK